MKANVSTSVCLALAFCLSAISCGRGGSRTKTDDSSSTVTQEPDVIWDQPSQVTTNGTVSKPRFDPKKPYSKVEFFPDKPTPDPSTPAKIEELRTKVALLEANVQSLQNMIIDQRFAMINPLSRVSEVLRTDFATFYIACEGAEPYLNGHKLKLRIGNPLNASFNAFKIECEYGLKEPNEGPIDNARDVQRWSKAIARQTQSLRRMEASFPQELVAGAWNQVELILAPSTPEELGYIKISMTTEVISLRTPRPK